MTESPTESGTATATITEPMPDTLNAAIATEPIWLQAWVGLLVIANLGAIAFVMTKRDGRLRVRIDSVAILASFFAAAALMTWMYDRVGYVRLLGLPHLLFWGPVFAWLLFKYRKRDIPSPFRHYLLFYLTVAGVSLVIDCIDVARYITGETAPLHLA